MSELTDNVRLKRLARRMLPKGARARLKAGIRSNPTDRTSRMLGFPAWGSQFGQAFFVGSFLMRGKSGFFVDVGAKDGVSISNTLALEKLGWSGILLEPHPELFSLCCQHRAAQSFNVAASSDHGSLDFVEMLEEPFGHSGLVSSFRDPDVLKSQKHKIIKVEARPLTEILDEAGAPHHIDYLDIDVEGHELEVIKGIDFSRYTFGVVGVEARVNTKEYGDIATFLAKSGYVSVCNLGSDIFFTKVIEDPLAA
ncbi:FkbM family methyltransferase [Roseobacter sp. A03A-229]